MGHEIQIHAFETLITVVTVVSFNNKHRNLIDAYNCSESFVVDVVTSLSSDLLLFLTAGTNEKAIIEILTTRTNEQRLKIAEEYKSHFGKVVP